MRRKFLSRRRCQDVPRVVLLVAGGLLQIPMARAIKRRGYLLVVTDNDERCIARELADLFCKCDIRSVSALIEMVHALHERQPIAFAITAATDFSRQVAIINQTLSHSVVAPISAATLTTDKSEMRTTLQRHHIAIPRFLLLKGADGLSGSDMPLPAVIKPVDNMGGRGVKLVSSFDELPVALRAAQSHSDRNEVLLEQYITDPEYSVEMLVRNYRPFAFVIAERYIYCRPFFIEMGHLLPAALSRRACRIIRVACRRVIRVIGIRHGVAKFDLFYRNRKTTIGEVACRLSGGYMSGWTFPQARGYDLTARCLAITEQQLHSRPRVRSRAQIGSDSHALRRGSYSGECSMLSLPGRIVAINGIRAARALPGVTHLFTRYHPGDRVNFPTNNVQKCLNIIIATESASAFWKTAHAARRKVNIRLATGDEQTLAFLFTDSGRQFPMAYPPPPPLLSWLETQSDGHQLSATNVRNPTLALPPAIPFLIDWHEYSLRETLERLRDEYQLTVVTDQLVAFDQSFWRAILKGGLQGGRFFLDTLREKSNVLTQWIIQWDGNISDV